MTYTRRQALALGGAAAAMAAMAPQAFAAAEDIPMVGSIEEFTGGADMGSGELTLTAPEIAENGNTVPIEVSAPGAAEVRVYATGNPVPGVAVFTFGPLAASQSASTRIRLAGTQDVVAVAKMQDGSFIQASKEVKVTIGGCGG